MTDALMIYKVLPIAWRMSLLCLGFLLLMGGRTITQWSFYNLKTDGKGIGPLKVLSHKHDTDLFSGVAPYVVLILAGIDCFLLAGLSMLSRMFIQGWGVNHGHGVPFIDVSESATYKVPLLGVSFAKPPGYWRLLWTAFGIALVTWRAFVLA